MSEPMYDIGELKNDPEQLYDLALKCSALLDSPALYDNRSEFAEVLRRVCNSLWGNLPPVLTIDFRDPDDPSTWGDFGAPST